MQKKISSKMLAATIAVSAIIVGITYFVVSFKINETAEIAYDSSGKEIVGAYTEQRVIKNEFKVTNNTGRLREKAKLIVYVPRVLSSSLRVHEEIISHPHKVLSDHLGNRSLEFEFRNLGVDARFSIDIETHFLTSTSPNRDPELMESDSASIGSAGAVGQQNRLWIEYQGEGFLLEVNSSEIRQVAQSLKSEEQDDSIENILTWVDENILDASTASGELSGDALAASHAESETDFSEMEMLAPQRTRDQIAGALSVLKKGEGGVWEKTLLVTALARACNVIARPVVGYKLNKEVQLSAWVEFYHDNRWKIADVQEAAIKDNPSDHLSARVFSQVPYLYVNSLDELLYSFNGLEVKTRIN